MEQSSLLYNSRYRCIIYQITFVVYKFPMSSVSYGPTTFNHSDVMVSIPMCKTLQIDVTISKIYSFIINESQFYGVSYCCFAVLSEVQGG